MHDSPGKDRIGIVPGSCRLAADPSPGSRLAGAPERSPRIGEPCSRLRRRTPERPENGPARVVARSKGALIFLHVEEVWAFEAVDRLSFVHSRDGRFDVDLSLSTFEASFGRPFVRVHRHWLVNLDRVKALEGRRGNAWLSVGTAFPSERIRVPVSRQHARDVRELLLRDAIGIRHG
jgi:two-component system response regulator LytT